MEGFAGFLAELLMRERISGRDETLEPALVAALVFLLAVPEPIEQRDRAGGVSLCPPCALHHH